MTSNHVISPDELLDIATGLISLPERRLMPTWAYVQSVKYNGLIHENDPNLHELIFRNVELPILMRLYPPEYVNPRVKKIISALAVRTTGESSRKLSTYLDLRKVGLSIEKARRQIQPIYTEKFLKYMKEKYVTPFRYKYEITSRDADLIYVLGIDQFIRLFYDRFYEPLSLKEQKEHATRNNR